MDFQDILKWREVCHKFFQHCLCITNLWCIARFGTIGTILKTYETHPWMSTTLGKLQPEATLAVLNKVYKQVTARFFNDLRRNILNVTLVSLIFQLKT